MRSETGFTFRLGCLKSKRRLSQNLRPQRKQQLGSTYELARKHQATWTVDRVCLVARGASCSTQGDEIEHQSLDLTGGVGEGVAFCAGAVGAVAQ